jgi:hypothetical protein
VIAFNVSNSIDGRVEKHAPRKVGVAPLREGRPLLEVFPACLYFVHVAAKVTGHLTYNSS